MKSPNEKPSASEFGQLRAYLAKRGFKQAQISAAIDTTVRNRTRAQITAALIAWLRGGQ